MTRALLIAAASLFLTSIASADVPKPLPSTPVLPVLPIKPLLLQCQGPDPAAVSLNFAVSARTTRFAGRVRITGTVKNIGTAPYISGPEQQLVNLYEMVPGGPSRLVASRRFQNEAINEEITVSYERAWNSSSPAEGEFPPTYKLIVTYDPDIRLDGNTKNDDCNGANNARERSGGDINAMFR